MRKHIPQRTCVACRRTGPKHSFTRLARAPGGRIKVDQAGSAPGRGAYVCPTPACWHTALKRRSLERALRIGSLHPADCTTLAQVAHHLEETTSERENDTPPQRGRNSPGQRLS